MIIRLLSINIWDLPVPLPGFERHARRRRLLAQLPALDADVIAVQEAFLPSFRRTLRDRLGAYHADALSRSRRRALVLELDAAGGLLLFSRWPISRTTFEPSRPFLWMKPDERIGRKGSLWTTIETPVGRLVVANVHLYAGIRRKHARVRSRQTRQLVDGHPLDPDVPVLLVGDFNMDREAEVTGGPPTGMAIMEGAGFREIAGGVSDGIATKAPSVNRYATPQSVAARGPTAHARVPPRTGTVAGPGPAASLS